MKQSLLPFCIICPLITMLYVAFSLPSFLSCNSQSHISKVKCFYSSNFHQVSYALDLLFVPNYINDRSKNKCGFIELRIFFTVMLVFFLPRPTVLTSCARMNSVLHLQTFPFYLLLKVNDSFGIMS